VPRHGARQGEACRTLGYGGRPRRKGTTSRDSKPTRASASSAKNVRYVPDLRLCPSAAGFLARSTIDAGEGRRSEHVHI
jgi:hypothetical protein